MFLLLLFCPTLLAKVPQFLYESQDIPKDFPPRPPGPSVKIIGKASRQDNEDSIDKINILSSMSVKHLHNIHVEFLTYFLFSEQGTNVTVSSLYMFLASLICLFASG